MFFFKEYGLMKHGKALDYICEKLSNSDLNKSYFVRELSIRGQELDDISAEKIVEMLKNNNSLHKLDLSF